MTHEEIMRKVIASGNVKIGEYISIAVANEIPKFEILDNLTALYKQATGENYKHKIFELIEKYMETYKVGSKSSVPEKARRKGNWTHARKVIYDGKLYESVTEAAIQNEKSRAQINYALKKGRAHYA